VKTVAARDDLTAREREIVQPVARGPRNAEIADALGIAHRTVEWNPSRIYRKFGVRSKLELATRVAGTTWVRGEAK
jgi:DNA-binding CsgD family transcriptional regulator